MDQALRDDPWVEISRNHGYSPAFLEQTKLNREKAARIEQRKQGLSRYRHWGMPEWAREIVIDVATRRGVCISEMASESRYRKIVRARNEAMYLVKERKPSLSCVQIGNWFNRDHTSFLHALAAYQELTGAPKLVGYDIKNSRERNRRAMMAVRKNAGILR